MQDSGPKEAVCKATCLKDGFQWVFTLLSCPMQTCFACRITGSCLDFRCLARAGRPFVHPIDLWYFPSRESTENAHFSCAFAGSKAPKNLARTMRLPALKNQRKSNEPSPFGRDGLLAEARFKDLLLFFHSLPAPPAVRACLRTQPSDGLKIFCHCFRKHSPFIKQAPTQKQ